MLKTFHLMDMRVMFKNYLCLVNLNSKMISNFCYIDALPQVLDMTLSDNILSRKSNERRIGRSQLFSSAYILLLQKILKVSFYEGRYLYHNKRDAIMYFFFLLGSHGNTIRRSIIYVLKSFLLEESSII